MSSAEAVCPGCGLEMPPSAASYDGYYNCSPECWSVYTEVLGEEFSNAILFGRVHQSTVDAYALQHAGGHHPDKSIAVHLVGLSLAFKSGHRSPEIAPLIQRLASRTTEWPHLTPPSVKWKMTVFDVAMADSELDQARLAREWAETVWTAWAEHHAVADSLVAIALES